MTLDIDAVYREIAAAVNDAELPGATGNVKALAFSPDAVTAPQFYLAEFTADYDKTFAGLMEMTITARLMLSRATDSTGQQEAQRLAGSGANTVYAALDAARGAPGPRNALNGEAEDIFLRRVVGPRLYDYGDAHFYGLEFTIFVMG